MSVNKFGLTAMLVVGFGAVSALNASIIFDNTVDITDAQVSQQGGYLLADDFVLREGANTITDVHWVGGFDPNLPSTNSFRIDFLVHDDPDYFVLTPIASYSPDPSSVVAVPTGQILFDIQPLVAYSVDIPALVLNPGQTYWLSIVSIPTANSLWSWGGQDGVGNAILGGSGGVIWIEMSDQLSMDFRLTGPSNGIPEPATLALFGLGLAGIGAVRRRRTVN